MLDYWEKSSDKLIMAVVQHLELSLLSLLLASILSGLITVILLFWPKLRQTTVYVLSLLYAIPSFALFALLIPLTGLGSATDMLVLVLYAQYILVRSFLTGLTQLDGSIVEAAVGLGMTRWQVLYKVQLPLAKPSLFAGLRLAAISIVSIATIASTINAGGLGMILFDGLRTSSLPKLLWGMLLTVGLSLLFLAIFNLLETLLSVDVSQESNH